MAYAPPRVPNSAANTTPPNPPIRAQQRAVDPQTRPKMSRESLGEKDINGVLAEGTRMTTTYPVGSVGNDKEFSAVTEFWMSRDLGMVVQRTTSDPRNGDVTMRTTNISRAEPDPSLFQPPSDYRIEDMGKGR
jgi:hypothetical protein